MSLYFVYFEFLLFDIMQPAIRFLNSKNKYSLNTMYEETEDVNISREGESPIPTLIENTRQVIAGQEVCNSVLASQRKNHLSQVTSDVYSFY